MWRWLERRNTIVASMRETCRCREARGRKSWKGTKCYRRTPKLWSWPLGVLPCWPLSNHFTRQWEDWARRKHGAVPARGMCVQSSKDVGHRNVKGAWRRGKEECWDPNVSKPFSSTSSSDQLPSSFPNGFHMNPKLSHMGSGKMKSCPRPYLGGDPLQWKRYPKEWSEETASERNKRAEISSWTLVGRMGAWALTWLVPNILARWFLITFVKLSNKRRWIMPRGNFLASVPEITLIRVKFNAV